MHRALKHTFVALIALVGALLVPNTQVGAFEQVAAFEQVSNDPRVEAALSLLDATPATNHLRAVLENNQVDVHFVSMAPGIYARYSVARHVIEIDERWIDSDEVTLAAVIAHEATHAQDAVSGYLSSGGASACIDSEVRAFRASAVFWLSQYGPQGKPNANSELDLQLNSIADRQQRDPAGLEQLVRQTYSQQCSPG